jgi:predicted nucleotidyltransferase
MFLQSAPNILPQVLPEYSHLQDVVRVIDVPHTTGGQVLRVLMNGETDQAVGFLATPESATRALPDKRRAPESTAEDHWRWRHRMAERMAAALDPSRFGVRACYLFGSTKNATAGPASDIDLLVHFAGTPQQRTELLQWLEGWSLCLSEMNFLRTGQRTDGLLDVHLITDEDIVRRTSWAAKIDAVTDAARLLPIGGDVTPR